MGVGAEASGKAEQGEPRRRPIKPGSRLNDC